MPDMAGWVGKTLGKVNVELLLARGGMADVYLGRHTTLQRAVAVKVLNSQSADDPDLLDRFQREARVVAMLRHPNIVQVHDFDTIDGRAYLIMEYVPGVSLADHMRALHKNGLRIDLPTIVNLVSAIGEALQYAHERGVIHRDVKPANILLTSPSAPLQAGKPLPADVHAVLTDFGLVRFLSSAQQTTRGQIAGTPAYMSPEQAAGSPVDARSDIYSLGIVLYELLAGRVPFEADSALAVLQMHISEAPPPVPGLQVGLEQVLGRALEKDPPRRFASAREFVVALRAASAVAEERSEIPASEAATVIEEAVAARPQLRIRTWLSAAVAGLIIVALAGILGVRSLTSPPVAASDESTGAPSTDVAAPAGPAVGDPIGVLRFQDGASLVDEVTFKATSMPAPKSGSQYEIWLVAESGEERRSVGYLQLDATGNGTATFVDAEGRNLLSFYNGVELTLEPDPDPSPNPSGKVAYSTTLPPDALLHVRHLLVSFGRAPKGTGLLDGLLQDGRLASTTSKSMLSAYESGDEAGTRSAAEDLLNLIVGAQSSSYADWDGDGQVEDPGDGYGLLLNGDNSGYIQGSFDHAQFAATADDATDNMQSHGEHVMVATRNLDGWTTQLRDITKQILAAPFDPSMGALIRRAVALSDNMLAGTDLNGNERVEAITGEGGAETAYQHSLYMADMVVTLGK